MEKSTISMLEVIRLSIAEEITKKYHLPYDSAEQKFEQSVTWSVIQDVSTDFYLKSTTELFSIYESELRMDQYLEKQLQRKSPNLISNGMMGKLAKRFAILYTMSIEESLNWMKKSDEYQSLLKQLQRGEQIESPQLFHKKVLKKKKTSLEKRILE